MKKILIPIVALLAACAGRQSTNQPKDAAAEPVIQQTASEQEAALVTEVRFTKGSAQLSREAKTRLEKLIVEAKHRGKIDDIKVISWSDLNYPSKAKGSLSKQQRDLASQRNEEVEKYVKNYSETYVDVDSYNMAERPNTFEEWFNTSDNKIKKSLETAGIATTADGSLALPNKRSTAMVLVVLEK